MHYLFFTLKSLLLSSHCRLCAHPALFTHPTPSPQGLCAAQNAAALVPLRDLFTLPVRVVAAREVTLSLNHELERGEFPKQRWHFPYAKGGSPADTLVSFSEVDYNKIKAVGGERQNTDEEGVFISKSALDLKHPESATTAAPAARKLLQASSSASASASSTASLSIEVNPLGLRSFVFQLAPDAARVARLLPFLNASALFRSIRASATSSASASSSLGNVPRAPPRTSGSAADAHMDPAALAPAGGHADEKVPVHGRPVVAALPAASAASAVGDLGAINRMGQRAQQEVVRTQAVRARARFTCVIDVSHPLFVATHPHSIHLQRYLVPLLPFSPFPDFPCPCPSRRMRRAASTLH